MVSEKLKTNTQKPHQQLETLIVQKIKQFDSIVSYVNFLRIFYGYIAAIEQKLTPLMETDGILTDFSERRKAEYLLQDISALSQKSAIIPMASDLPEMNSAEQALGIMYVLEGSTLGGKYISRMISDKLDLESDTGLSYFNGYKENTYTMWNRFKEALDSHTMIESSELAIVDAANQTFIKFRNWINEN